MNVTNVTNVKDRTTLKVLQISHEQQEDCAKLQSELTTVLQTALIYRN